MLFYRFDQLLLEFAVKHNVWIVMTDEAFMDGTGYGKVIYPPQAHKMKRSGRGKPKRRTYEEWWTILCKKLHKIMKTSPAGSSP